MASEDSSRKVSWVGLFMVTYCRGMRSMKTAYSWLANYKHDGHRSI